MSVCTFDHLIINLGFETTTQKTEFRVASRVAGWRQKRPFRALPEEVEVKIEGVLNQDSGGIKILRDSVFLFVVFGGRGLTCASRGSRFKRYALPHPFLLLLFFAWSVGWRMGDLGRRSYDRSLV